jgi:hypothetical protein
MFSVVWDIQTSISSNRQDIENTVMERYYLRNPCPKILLISRPSQCIEKYSPKGVTKDCCSIGHLVLNNIR